MKLSEITTDKTRYDVHRRDLITAMGADIQIFADYLGKLPTKKLFQYIILMYDPESTMRREVGHYMQRKSECAKIVGFQSDGEKWVPGVEEMLIGRDEGFNKLVAAYLSHIALPEYTELIVLLEIQRIKTMEAFSGEVTDNTHKTIQAVTENISRITKKLFGSGEFDEIQAARRALYAQSNIDKPPRPEDMVDMINDSGLTPDCNPYGVDYVVEEAHFSGVDEPEG